MSRKKISSRKINTLFRHAKDTAEVHLYVDCDLDHIRLMVKGGELDFDIKVDNNSRSDTCQLWIKKVRKEFGI